MNLNIVRRILEFGTSLLAWRIKDTDAPDSEIVKIYPGLFFLVGPRAASSQCIYINAMVTIGNVPSIEHGFQLVVTRLGVLEEGEDSEDVLDDEKNIRVFLINEELEFCIGLREGHPALVWRAEDIGETYEFVATGAKSTTIQTFALGMYRAMYERTHGIRSEEASLNDFVVKPKVLTKEAKVSTLASQGKDKPETQPKSRTPTVTSTTAELYLWEQDDGHFLKQADIVGSIGPRSSCYYITATTDKGQQLISHKISSELNARWSAKLSSATWNHTTRLGYSSSWCMKFRSIEDFKEFRKAYSACLNEAIDAANARGGEQTYLLRSSGSGHVTMEDTEGDDEYAVESAFGDVTNDSESEPELDGGDEPAASMPTAEKDDLNSQLAVGNGEKNNRTFVVRGDKIGVFNHSDEGKMEYAATINDLGFRSMKGFKPKHIMLHDLDTKMVLMNPLREHSLFAVDVEYGKIVDEWKVDDDITINNIAPASKYAQNSGEQTLVGISSNALFRIDPRLGGRGGNAMADSMRYATKNKFSVVATTANGKLAVASEKGDIRLFDTVGKIAKTALPAMGDPIIGIDVTGDGRWIVATCKTYLYIIDTLIGDGKYAGSLGFDRAFPANPKPQPKRLQLRPEHTAYMDHDVSFTPSRFNSGGGEEEENAIITSTGCYVVAWDFAKVKKNKLDSYVIKKFEDMVVQDNFRHGDANEIVVALANDVLSLNKKDLKKLPRGSFTTPV